MNLKINDTFRIELPADKILENYQRQVTDACFSYVVPKKTSKPKLVHVSKQMLTELGINETESTSEAFLHIFTGNKILNGTHPYAMCYGGHQFGNWAGQLGDGRAINLFETTHHNKRWAIQLKGAGATPFSRNADGQAVLRSSIREYLCSEAMFHLGIPTTRAVSLALSGEKVLRDVLYDGNHAYEQGAIVCRAAESFIRFGNFEILTARKNIPTLKKLADYTIKHFFAEISSEGKQKYIDFFAEVRNRTLEMLIHWQRVGFVHGVMNTDNMSVLGLTIDYGPYGWLENYDGDFTPNTTDTEKRYCFKNQEYIGIWNLFKLANALYPLIEEVAPLQKIIDECKAMYRTKYNKMMFDKLGLFACKVPSEIISDLEKNLALIETDYTIFFRKLSNISKNDSVEKALSIVNEAFYNQTKLNTVVLNSWKKWFVNYIDLLHKEPTPEKERKRLMNLVNPKYIFRNYMAQLAIEDAEKGNYQLIDEFYELLQNPYKEQPKFEKWFNKRPEWARNKIGCSVLSCSS